MAESMIPGGEPAAHRHEPGAGAQADVLAPAEVASADQTALATVCIPTYRRPQLLARAIGSVTTGAGEASHCVDLLVSDNSPADSEAVAREALAAWHGRSAYHPQEVNLGLVGNVNYCLEQASGRFVLVLHDDDYLLPGGLTAIVERLRGAAEDDVVVAFGVDVVDAHGRVRRTQAATADQRVAPAAAVRGLLTDSSYLRMPAVVVRRDAYHEAGGFRDDLGGAEDLDMWLRLCARHGLRTVPAVVSAYTVHQAAATTQMFDATSIEILLGLFKDVEAMDMLDPNEIRQCEQQWFHQFILGGAFRELQVGDTAAARAILRLFAVPGVRELGWSTRWLLVRLAMTVTARLPGPIASATARAGARLGRRLIRWHA